MRHETGAIDMIPFDFKRGHGFDWLRRDLSGEESDGSFRSWGLVALGVSPCLREDLSPPFRLPRKGWRTEPRPAHQRDLKGYSSKEAEANRNFSGPDGEEDWPILDS
jgi:hypothetical protein